MELVELIEPAAGPRPVSISPPDVADAAKAPEPTDGPEENKENAPKMRKLSGYVHYSNSTRAGVKAEIDADEANAALTAQEKNQKVMQVLGARWKGLDDGAKATWAAAAPEYEVKPKKPKKAKPPPALTDAERDTAREMLMGIVAEKLKERDSLEGAFDGPAAPAAIKPAAPAPEPMEVVMKKLSGKEFYNKETRAEAKAAVERDHADAGGKEKQALIQKALGAGWKVLDDGAKAKWAADAPEVEVKKKRAREEPAPPAPAPAPAPLPPPAGGKKVKFWVEAPASGVDEREWAYRAHALKGARRVRDDDACFDDKCAVCYEGGDLACCVSCPRVFHVKCLEKHVGAEFAPGAAKRGKDLGGKKKGPGRPRAGDHAPAAAAVVAAAAATDDDEWHCPACLASHAETCVHCGEGGDGETRLLPCGACPRAYHASCARVGEPGALLVAAGTAWRCVGCAAAPAADDGVDASLDAALRLGALAEIERLCARLPRDHFASVFGTRLGRVRALAAEASAAGADARTAAALDGAHDVAAVASRLHFDVTVRDDSAGGSRSRACVAADAWARAAPALARLAADGLAAVPGALSSEDVARAKAMVEDYYEDVVHTVSQLNLSEDLVNGGFSTFKTRDRGRFDMVVPGLAQLLEAAGAAWMPLVKALLGDDARLCHAGCITALPDCAGQRWHSDGDHVHDEMQLPAHAVNVFVPLIDSGLRQGATEFVPKTHYDWSADERPVVLEAHAGDAVIFDWRLKHRGLANKGAANRPLLYMTYSKPWFVDKYNFSKDRYEDLPPLVPRTTREGRSERRQAS